MFSGHAPVPFEIVPNPLGGASLGALRPGGVEVLGASLSVRTRRSTARSGDAASCGGVKGTGWSGSGPTTSNETSTSDSTEGAGRLDGGTEGKSDAPTTSSEPCRTSAQTSQRPSPARPARNVSLGWPDPAIAPQYATPRLPRLPPTPTPAHAWQIGYPRREVNGNPGIAWGRRCWCSRFSGAVSASQRVEPSGA